MNFNILFPIFAVVIIITVIYQLISQKRKGSEVAGSYKGEVSADASWLKKINLLPGEQILFTVGEMNYRRTGTGYIKYPGVVLQNMIVTSDRFLIPSITSLLGQNYQISIFYNKEDIQKIPKSLRNYFVGI